MLFSRNLGQMFCSQSRFCHHHRVIQLSMSPSLWPQGVCHRDLKLENTLLSTPSDGGNLPDVKICDFGYSKSALHHSQPKSTVGTPAYIAPEVLQRKEYKASSAIA